MKLILSILLFTNLSFSYPTRFLSPNALKLDQGKSKINSDGHEPSTEVKFPGKRKSNSFNPGLNHKVKQARSLSNRNEPNQLIANSNEPEKKIISSNI